MNSFRKQACSLCVALVFLSFPLAGALSASAESAAPEFPRPTMRAVFDEMKVLIPLSLKEERWSSTEERAKILAALERLAGSASALERHGRDREAGFGELAINLSDDLQQTLHYFRRGEFEASRFFLTGSLQTCIACHVRLPTDRSFPLATELTDKVELDTLSAPERAWLLVTIRRFDEALGTWEGMIFDPEIEASRVDSSGVLVDYLNVAIRVRGDVERAAQSLGRFAARPDLPLYLTRRVQEWREELGRLDASEFEPEAKGSLARGVALAKSAGLQGGGPYGRDGLIQDLAAASQLVRWLEEERADRRRATVTRNLTEKERADFALAYYWLGVVEARSLDGFWVNLSEKHFEASIRSDPKGPLAERAYSILEETQVLGYGGSSGVHLPTDVWNLLRELRELMGLEKAEG